MLSPKKKKELTASSDFLKSQRESKVKKTLLDIPKDLASSKIRKQKNGGKKVSTKRK